jgi:hypothetical protein
LGEARPAGNGIRVRRLSPPPHEIDREAIFAVRPIGNGLALNIFMSIARRGGAAVPGGLLL